MSPLLRDPHPTCATCRVVKCTTDVTCDICKDWSVAQWEVFFEKITPIVSIVNLALQALPFPLLLLPFLPLPLLLRKLGTLHLLIVLPPLLRRGVVVRGSRRTSLALALMGSPLPPPAIRGGGMGVVASGGKCDSAASSLQGVGGSGAFLISGVICARLLCPSLGRLFCLCRA